jgi:fructokinase
MSKERASKLQHVAGVELGGTKCICTLGASPDEVLAQETVPTTTPKETLGAIERILADWWGSTRFAAIGIASFGPVDLDPGSPTYGYITTTTKPGWSGTDVARRLSRPFPVPMSFDTDVNAAALAEVRWGAGQGMRDFAYVTVGTGIGVGLIVNGSPTRGFAHSELGHIRVARAAGDDCRGACPYHGDCVEGLAAGSAIEARLGERSLANVAADDPLWDFVAHTLAQLCHMLVCSTGPQHIVIGGGVMSRQPHLMARIEPLLVESLAGYMRLPEGRPYVGPPGLGDKAGPLGPIALALESACRADEDQAAR